MLGIKNMRSGNTSVEIKANKHTIFFFLSLTVSVPELVLLSILFTPTYFLSTLEVLEALSLLYLTKIVPLPILLWVMNSVFATNV